MCIPRFFRYYVKHHSLPSLSEAGLKHFKNLVYDVVKAVSDRFDFLLLAAVFVWKVYLFRRSRGGKGETTLAVKYSL